ncbi:MAG: hypothetical protein PHP86_18000 [Nevskiales bacterium]|nr:hypothetical protein [Nevskiales bacterium]
MAIQELTREEVEVVSGGASLLAPLDGLLSLVGGLLETVLSVPPVQGLLGLVDGLTHALGGVVNGLLGWKR